MNCYIIKRFLFHFNQRQPLSLL